MIRMSRKAWNNIIIFAMLLMIFLFNATTNILNGPDDKNQPVGLLPEHSLLMTLQSNGFEIQRIGTGWRLVPAADITQEQVHAIVENWQMTTITPIETPSPENNSLIVIAWLAGVDQGLVFQLYQQQQDILVQHQGNWFIINDSDLKQFTINPTEENN